VVSGAPRGFDSTLTVVGYAAGIGILQAVPMCGGLIALVWFAVAVIIGHMYPVFHRFQGGKGVATALGVLLGLNVWLAAGAASTWIIIALFFRMSSLAAIIAAVSAPVYCYMLYGIHPYTLAVGVIALLLLWRHQSNIRNLLAGTEGRIGGK
jgi:glycerol-3-phosphate acyltransferase PlsY